MLECSDPAAVAAQSEDIKARYDKGFSRGDLAVGR